MDTIEVKWSKLISLVRENIEANVATNQSGVYRLSSKNSSGNFIVFYVAQTDNIQKILLEHVDSRDNSEQGDCVKEKIVFFKPEDVKFRYAIINDEKTRKAAAKYLYKHYAPICNSKEPASEFDIIIPTT